MITNGDLISELAAGRPYDIHLLVGSDFLKITVPKLYIMLDSGVIFSDAMEDGLRIIGSVTKKDLKVSFEILGETSRYVWGDLAPDGRKITSKWGWQPG